MNQKSKKEVNTKNNKIVGRSSNAEIERRRLICEELRKINPCMSKYEFLRILKAAYTDQKIPIPTDQTINANIKKWNIDFKNPSKKTSAVTSFNCLGRDIHQKLRQIRINFLNESMVIFDYEKVSKISYDKFKDSNILYRDKKNFLSTLSKLDNRPMTPDTLFQLSIILKEKGLSEYITNIFDSNFISPKPFLYSEIHDYCAIIVFEYKNYDKIMNSAYQIVEEYPISNFN